MIVEIEEATIRVYQHVDAKRTLVDRLLRRRPAQTRQLVGLFAIENKPTIEMQRHLNKPSTLTIGPIAATDPLAALLKDEGGRKLLMLGPQRDTTAMSKSHRGVYPNGADVQPLKGNTCRNLTNCEPPIGSPADNARPWAIGHAARLNIGDITVRGDGRTHRWPSNPFVVQKGER